MNDQAQPTNQSPEPYDQGDSGRYGGGGNGPQADPRLTRRFQLLEDALHGPRRVRRGGSLNWSGVDETAVAFSSIEKVLNSSVPPDRPTSDLPDRSDTKPKGS